MIKAIVVDDERLVRKGFISLIDWPSFGVVIVGEAGDGNAALALLREQEADLLFVDITMPGMSGFELIRQVRQQFPAIRCVVLTCHHEFDYVQEALRLGAVDYIVKTLLEVENADATISRLVERVRWEDSTRESLSRREASGLAADRVLLFVPLKGQVSEEELFQLPLAKNQPLIALQGQWIVPLQGRMSGDALQRELRALPAGRWQAALVSGLQGRMCRELEPVLGKAARLALFYYGGEEEPPRLDYAELALAAEGAAGEAPFPASGHQLRWALERGDWDSFTAEMLLRRPAPEAVADFGHSLLKSWSPLLLSPAEAAELKAAISGNVNWCSWKQWLREFAGHVQRRMIELGLSKEVMFCLIRAVLYMKQNAGSKINQGDVAAHINMSRGYFSQCFARFAGESFGEVLRGMRLELAKSLLLETTHPVHEIACRSGFEDDRYFSRLFRERVGRLPSEYRAQGAKL
ncbi:response regulator transcription factor [Paenibacillus camerounensis]|uniref:response regulator transcription factor n=1 Tax=Paenibacillus camerounensis TaxID=1243663 RepID=UPI0005A9E9CB|nr:response regulator [Paenibacillus camerounensis]